MEKDKKTSFIAAIILTGFVASVFFHYFKGAYLGMPYPHNTFLFIPKDRFMDYFNLLDWNKDLNPYLRGVATAQYPLLNLLSFILSMINHNVSFLIYNAVVISGFVYINSIYLVSKEKLQLYICTFIVSLLTYPFLFTIDRGNFEILLCIFLLLFMYFYQKEKYITSTIFLSCAIAMKLFPVVMLALFIADKKYKETALTILWTLLLSLICLAIFKGGLYENVMYLLQGGNLANNSNIATFVGNNNLVQRGVTLFTFFKASFCQLGLINNIDMIKFLKFYKIIMIVNFLFLFLYIMLVERELWKKVALLVFAMLLFPHISADYKLIHVFIPLFIFINAEADKKYDIFYTIMFSFLLIPKDYVFLNRVFSDSGTYDISIGVLINPLIMMVMMAVIILTGFRKTNMDTIKSTLKEHIEHLSAICRFRGQERLQ